MFNNSGERSARELTAIEIEKVSGAGIIGEYAADFAGVGSVVGFMVDSTVIGATRGGLVGGMLGASFGGGYLVGSYIYGRASGS